MTTERHVPAELETDPERIVETPIPSDFPRTFDLRTTALASGISEQSWLELVRAGTVPAVTFGRPGSQRPKVLIRAADVAAYLASLPKYQHRPRGRR